MSKNRSRQFSEHVAEIRFKPNPKIIDNKGVLTEKLAKELSFPEWRISDSSVKLTNNPLKQSAFFGFRNAGFTTLDSPTADYFADHVIKFFKIVLNLESFEKPLTVERLGVRSRFF